MPSLKSTAVIFDIPVLATVLEGDPEVSVCVVMTTNPPQANIASEVEVHLRTADGTGIANVGWKGQLYHCNSTATANDGDFSYDSLPLTFAPGFHDGAQICSSIEIISDTKAEGEEEFFVKLNTPALRSRTSVSLGHNTTTVIITDDDGMLYSDFMCSQFHTSFLISCILLNACFSDCC